MGESPRLSSPGPKRRLTQRAPSPLKPGENALTLLQTRELLLYDSELACPSCTKRAWNCTSDRSKHIRSPGAVREHPGVLTQAHTRFERRILLIRVSIRCNDNQDEGFFSPQYRTASWVSFLFSIWDPFPSVFPSSFWATFKLKLKSDTRIWVICREIKHTFKWIREFELR